MIFDDISPMSATSPVTSTSARSTYRSEIDGLRAFAVIAVIINHFNKDLLPSGYLGVDIFFVISGYVITSSLVSKSHKNFGDFLLGFYSRRVKRIVPALVVCVVITSILTYLFSATPKPSLWTGAHALFGFSNIYLYQQATDYWGTSAELNTFTQTWSLGVEEQFYFFFPFLFWFTGFSRQMSGTRNFFCIVATLTLASLIGFIYLSGSNQPAAYFLMPPRFWELGTGCLLFLGLKRTEMTTSALFVRGRPLAVLAALVGTLFIPLEFSVLATIAVVVLTAILIFSLHSKSTAYRLLTHRHMVYVGLISYSLYLWHWCILSISHWTIGIHWWSVPIQVSVILLLSLGSYRLVERPLRRAEWSKMRWKSIGYGVATCIVVAPIMGGLLRWHTKLYLGRKDFQLDGRYQGLGIVGCAEKNLISCPLETLFTPRIPSSNRFVVIGNSHVSTISPVLQKLREETGIGYLSAQVGMTFPIVPFTFRIGGDKEDRLKGAEEVNSLFYKRALPPLEKGDNVILSSFLERNFIEGTLIKRFKDNPIQRYSRDWKKPISANEALKDWSNEVQRLAQSLHARGINLILIAPHPTFPENNPIVCTKEWFRPDTSTCSAKFSISREKFRQRILPISSVLTRLSKENANIYVFDPFPLLCPPSNTLCFPNIGDTQLYTDEHHLSTEGSLFLYDDFTSFLSRNNLLK
jgi:peptidoglycan/LPS O-acetylase OafA/YrhL